MKRRLMSEHPPIVVATFDQLTNKDHVGYLSPRGEKGAIHCIGLNNYSRINVKSGLGQCNTLPDGFNPYDTLRDCVEGSKLVTDWFIFDTREELYKWLAE